MLYVDSHKPFKLLSWCLISPSNVLIDFLSTSVSVLLSQQWPPQISPAKENWKVLEKCGSNKGRRRKICQKSEIALEMNQRTTNRNEEIWQKHINYLNVANGHKYISQVSLCWGEINSFSSGDFLPLFFFCRHFSLWLRCSRPSQEESSSMWQRERFGAFRTTTQLNGNENGARVRGQL